MSKRSPQKAIGWRENSTLAKIVTNLFTNHAIIWIGLAYCFLVASCQQNNLVPPEQTQEDVPEVEVKLEQPANINDLSLEEKKQLYNNLQVFYSGTPEKWQQAKLEILAMGPVGTEALCLFYLKFFTGNIQQGDATTYWDRAAKEMADLGEVAVPYLLLAMAHPKMGTTGRIQCSRVLINIGKPAVDNLINNLYRSHNAFRRSVIETLANIGDPRASAPLAEMYHKLPQPEVKSQDQDEILAQDKSYDLRYYCIKALGKLKSDKGLSALKAALDDPVKIVRKQAIESLLEFSSPAAVPALKKAQKVSLDQFPGYYRRLKVRIKQAQREY